ncbi:aquaporin [Mycobacterium europaeum]|uniref:aquaporin n=1 Tax=Mycobacterium europaeum TaxID=761804 RepID=UPI000A15C614|nr:aquaporin [Mycobacterium europaeum]
MQRITPLERDDVTADADQAGAAGPPRTTAKCVVEAIGTLFLVFTCGAAVSSGNPLAPLAIGAVLMVMVYAGGHISGGHYNPAVTLAVLVRRRISLRDAAWYWAVQFGAGLIAAAVVHWVVDPAHTGTPATLIVPTDRLAAVFVVEFLFTFALCYVVLNVATSSKRSDNSYFGLAIGFTVVSGAFAVGAISGGAFNPSVTVGAAVVGLFAWPTLWIYLVAQAMAAVAAGLTYVGLNPDEI